MDRVIDPVELVITAEPKSTWVYNEFACLSSQVRLVQWFTGPHAHVSSRVQSWLMAIDRHAGYLGTKGGEKRDKY